MFKFRHGFNRPCGERCARGEHWLGRGRHGHGFRHMRGGGHRRLFDHGDLRFVILKLIADKPRYGYEVIKAIEEKVGGAYSPSPGVVYPTLTMLEELGYVSAGASEGGKKLHTITTEGAAFLEQNRAIVDAIFGRMAEIGAAQGGGPAPQVMRAWENLKTALRLKHAQGALSEEQIRAIAEALDAAVGKIERS